MFKEDHRTIVLQGGQHQAAGIGRCGWHQYGQPGDMRKPAPQGLFVLPAVAVAAATRGAHHDGRRPRAAGERLHFGGMVEQGVHAHAEEVHHVQLDDRAQTGHRGSHACSQEGTLADGSAAHASGPEAHQQVASQQRNVLSEQNDARILRHGLSRVRRRQPA